MPASASRVLVVANETVGENELLSELRRLKNETEAEYFVCAPAQPLDTGQGAARAVQRSIHEAHCEESADAAESDAMPRISDVVNTVEPQDVCGERA